jgi:hypothetical protein
VIAKLLFMFSLFDRYRRDYAAMISYIGLPVAVESAWSVVGFEVLIICCLWLQRLAARWGTADSEDAMHPAAFLFDVSIADKASAGTALSLSL